MICAAPSPAVRSVLIRQSLAHRRHKNASSVLPCAWYSEVQNYCIMMWGEGFPIASFMTGYLVESWRGHRWRADIGVSADLNFLVYGASKIGLLNGSCQSHFPWPSPQIYPPALVAQAIHEWPTLWRRTVDAHAQIWREGHPALSDGVLLGTTAQPAAPWFPVDFPAWYAYMPLVEREFHAWFGNNGFISGSSAVLHGFLQQIAGGPQRAALQKLPVPASQRNPRSVRMDLVFKWPGVEEPIYPRYLVVSPDDLDWPNFRLPPRLVAALSS